MSSKSARRAVWAVAVAGTALAVGAGSFAGGRWVGTAVEVTQPGQKRGPAVATQRRPGEESRPLGLGTVALLAVLAAGAVVAFASWKRATASRASGGVPRGPPGRGSKPA